jgi:hypothetical protein
MVPNVGPTYGVVSATVLVLWWQGIKKLEIGVICSGIKFIPGVMKIGTFSQKMNDDGTHIYVCR